MANLLGISQRTVERYVRGQFTHPRADLAERLADAVRARWKPGVRARAQKTAATTTRIVIETRARFGFTAASGTTDDGRMRRLTQFLPSENAGQLFSAHEQGASERELQRIATEGLQEVYFKDGGRRAGDLTVEFTDI
ncbi:XRE family transcriptional regulator [Streptomyces asoensis]